MTEKPIFPDLWTNGTLEVVIGEGCLAITSSDSGPIVRILNAKHIVIHYLDHDNTQIFGSFGDPKGN
jgi:hypothetical protein